MKIFISGREREERVEVNGGIETKTHWLGLLISFGIGVSIKIN